MKDTMQFINAFSGKPLLIEAATLRQLLAAVNSSATFPALSAAGGQNGKGITILSGVAVIPILNVLSYRPLFWSFLYGGTSYQEIRENFSRALDNSSVKAIVMDVASPGGTTAGLFDLVDEIYRARSVKPIYSVINESALSAAYLIASAAGKVFLPRLGRAGSIGCLGIHIDRSAAEAKAGLKLTEIYAGAHKIDGTPHAPLTDKARAVFQKDVDQIQDLLIETVARNRGLKPVDVRAQQAKLYTGKEAVAQGLADAVLSWDAAWKQVVSAKPNQDGLAIKTKLQSVPAAKSGTQIRSTIDGTSVDGANPLVEAAKKAAADYAARTKKEGWPGSAPSRRI